MCFVLQKKRLKGGRGHLVSVFHYLMGKFAKKGATLFADRPNRRIRDNRQIARR